MAQRDCDVLRQLQKIKAVEQPKKKQRRYSLKQLLVGLTKENEIDWGPPVGNENLVTTAVHERRARENCHSARHRLAGTKRWRATIGCFTCSCRRPRNAVHVPPPQRAFRSRGR